MKTRRNVWTFKPDTLVLRLTDPVEYEVYLGDCKTAAQALDWIAQIAGKTWTTDTALADLVRALDNMLDLQGNLCGMGHPGTIEDVKAEIKGRSVQPVRLPE